MAEPVRLLMIEDDEEDFLIARTLLQRACPGRFMLERRGTLRDGLAAIALETDAVLLDLSLPDSQGWGTFQRVREHAPHVPVILLTGLDDESLGIKAVHGGAQDYLVKGQFDGRLLSRAILYAIERKTAEERLEHLADELGVANAIMAADLAMAREVQQALVPRPASVTARASARAPRLGMLYRPCASLGGDFFAVLPVSETKTTVLVCDVVGHGVRSALITAVLRGLVEESRALADDPGRFLSQINRAFMSVLNLPEHVLFVTAVCVCLDGESGRLRGANAGHPAPLRVSPGGESEWVSLHGPVVSPALGLDAAVVYPTVETVLAPGDRLVLYTDGVHEACASDGGEYGRDRLLAAVRAAARGPVEALPASLLDDMNRFLDGCDIEDDVCIVGLECGTRPAVGAT